MRIHFHHSYGGSQFGPTAPPPQWVHSVPLLPDACMAIGYTNVLIAGCFLALLLLVLLVHFFWWLAGALTGMADR